MLSILSKYKYSLIFTVLLFVILTFFLDKHIHWAFAVINIVFIFLIYMLISNIKNNVISNVIMAIISFILSGGIAFALLFQIPLRVGNLASIIETNPAEASTMPAQVYLVSIAAYIITIFLSFCVKYELKNLISSRIAAVLLLGVVIIINALAFIIPAYRMPFFFNAIKNEFREEPFHTVYVYSGYRMPLLYGDLFAFAVYGYEKYEVLKLKNSDRKIPEGLTFYAENPASPKIYLVIGESAYRKNMSLYGYEIETTPFLDSLARNDSTSIGYFDGISVANLTRNAIRFSMSFATVKQHNDFWFYKNPIELANDLDYYSVWLSNQEKAGLHDNYPSYIAQTSQKTYFTPSMDKEDFDLIELLPKFHKKDQKQLITLHLVGSHFPYNIRYDSIDEAHFKDMGEVSGYNKTLHHTDRVLKALYDYSRANDSSSIIVYYSDHGTSPERGLHGLQNASSADFEIPMVFIKHNLDKLNIDSIASNYVYRGHIGNSNIPYILSEIMGYSVDAATHEKARIDGEYFVLPDGQTARFRELEGR